MLKVQLLDVTMNQLLQWTAELDGEHNLSYVLKNTILVKSVSIGNVSHETMMIEHSHVRSYLNFNALSPVAKFFNSLEDKSIKNNVTTPSTLSALLSSTFFDLTDMSASDESTLANINEKSSLDCDDLTEKPIITENNTISPEKFGIRPLLGSHPITNRVRPILGYKQTPKKTLKKDVLPALMVIDNRQLKTNFPSDELLTIAPTYIGQLERFFGVVHRRDECYLQHMWTYDEIPMSSRYVGSRVPYIFDIVLAKNSVDQNLYRAKVIEICKEMRNAYVFFVEYGGCEYVDLYNLANGDRSISDLPFQAFGVDLLRSMLLKKTFTVRHEDERFYELPAILIRKGFIEQFNEDKLKTDSTAE